MRSSEIDLNAVQPRVVDSLPRVGSGQRCPRRCRFRPSGPAGGGPSPGAAPCPPPAGRSRRFSRRRWSSRCRCCACFSYLFVLEPLVRPPGLPVAQTRSISWQRTTQHNTTEHSQHNSTTQQLPVQHSQLEHQHTFLPVGQLAWYANKMRRLFLLA